MSKPVYRPPSVWITQVLLASFLFITAIALPIALLQCFSSGPQNCLSLPSIKSFALVSLSFVLALLTFWGLQKRKRYGKWLAVSILVCLIVGAIAENHSLQLIYQSITQWQPLPAPPYECWEKEGIIENFCGYRSYPELVLRIVSDILPALFLGFLVVRLLYNPAVKLFFHR